MLVVLFFMQDPVKLPMFNIDGLDAVRRIDTDPGARLSGAAASSSMISSIIPMIIMPQLLAKFVFCKTFGISATLCAIVGFVFCMLHYATD